MRIRLYINDCPIKDAEPANAEEMWEIIAQWKMDYKLTSDDNYQVYQYVASKMTANEPLIDEPIEDEETEEIEPERTDRGEKERKYRNWDRPWLPHRSGSMVPDFSKPCPRGYVFHVPHDVRNYEANGR